MKSRHCAAVAAGTLLLTGLLSAQAQTSVNTAPGHPITAKKVTQAGATSSAPNADEKSQFSYSLGLLIGNNLHSTPGMSAGTLSFERMVAGLRAALSGKATPSSEDSQRVQAYLAKEVAAQSERNAAEGGRNKAAADRFLAANGKLPGVVTTASGLQYKILTPGAGVSPKITDTVTVNYRGNLLDGTEFDSSYKRNEPAEFPVGGVIHGWVEGLQLMKPGAKFEFYIPPALAYGMQPPPGIPSGALLKFEVELLSVKPAAATTAPPVGATAQPKH